MKLSGMSVGAEEFVLIVSKIQKIILFRNCLDFYLTKGVLQMTRIVYETIFILPDMMLYRSIIKIPKRSYNEIPIDFILCFFRGL